MGPQDELLRRLSQAAAAQPPLSGHGRFGYVQTSGWYLHSSQLLVGDQLHHADSRREAVEREVWVAPDGSGRIEERCDGRRTEASADYPAGELDTAPAAPTEPRSLRSWLSIQLQEQGLLRLLTALWSSGPVTPEVRAATVDVLTEHPDLRRVLPATDRYGRRGVQVALDSVMPTGMHRPPLRVCPGGGHG